MTGQAEMFNQLYAAPTDTLIRGVAFAPLPAPEIGHGLLGILAVGGLLFGAKLFERSRMRRMVVGRVPRPASASTLGVAISES